MNKRTFTLVIALFVVTLLCTPLALAIDTTTYASGWNEFISTVSYQGETFEVYGQTDLASSSSDDIDGTLLFYHNNKSTLVHFDDCETKGSFEFCFQNASFSHEKITTGEGISVYPAVQYTIKGADYTPYITLSLASQKTSLAPAQKATFALHVHNNHTSNLQNTKLTIVVPTTLVLEDSSLFSLISQDDDMKTYQVDVNTLRLQKQTTYSFTVQAQEELSDAMGSEQITASLVADIDQYKDVSFQANADIPVINPYMMLTCSLSCPTTAGVEEELFCKFSIQKQSEASYTLEELFIDSELSTQTISLQEEFSLVGESYVLYSFPQIFSEDNYVQATQTVNATQAQEDNMKKIEVSLDYQTPLSSYTCVAQSTIELTKKKTVLDILQESDVENPDFGKDAKEEQRTKDDDQEGFFEKLVRLIKSIF